MQTRWLKWAFTAGIIGLAMWPAADALARAGGGSSGGYHSSGGFRTSTSYSRRHSGHSGGSAGTGNVLPVVGALFGFISVFGLLGLLGNRVENSRIQKQTTDSTELLRRIARADDAWSPDHMRARVEKIYHHVQEAWTKRDQEWAKDFMSPRLYAQHKRQTDEMLREGKRNVLEQITLVDCDIIHVADRKGIWDDEFWAIITGSMVDYEVRDGDPSTQGKVAMLQKVAPEPAQFKELWKFTREDHGWVLDKIEQDISNGLTHAKVFSQEVGA